MKVKDLMTANPACCTPYTRLQDVACMMVEYSCGEIPIVDSEESCKPVGVVTDRDICCRAVAQGRNPLEMMACDVMSSPCITVAPETSLDDCCKLMEQNQIRRVPVVDASGWCCGIVAQADIAMHDRNKKEVAEVVEKISQPLRVAA